MRSSDRRSPLRAGGNLKKAKRVQYFLVLALVVLHHDVWNRDRLEPLVLGWIPFDLAYHLAWMGAAWLVLLHLCAKVWTDDEDAA